MWWRSIIAVFIFLSVDPIEAGLKFLNGPLTNDTILATAMTKDLGPQLGSSQPPAVGTFYAFAGNPCAPDSIPDEVAGKIVFITKLNLCAPYVQYDAFHAKGAIGLVRMLFTIPGRNYYGVSMFDQRLDVRNNSMFFLEIMANKTLVVTSTKVRNMTASVYPDPNPWVVMFASFEYQWIGRWPQALIYAYTTILVYIYLKIHINLLIKRQRRESNTADTQIRIWSVVSKFSPIHYALLIKAMVSPTMLVVTVLGGYFSSPWISHEGQLFFLRRLDGWDHAAVVLASVFYFRTLSSSKLVEHSFWINLVAALLCMFSVMLDTAAAIAYAMFSESMYPTLNLTWASYGTTFTFMTASFFIGNAALFWYRVRSNALKVGSNDPVMKAFLTRVSWYATATGICLMIQGIIYLTLSILLVTVIIYTPFIFCWQTILTNLVVAFKGYFLVQLLAPRRDAADASVLSKLSFVSKLLSGSRQSAINLVSSRRSIGQKAVASVSKEKQLPRSSISMGRP